jgi:ABC-2 type transport system permease protein
MQKILQVARAEYLKAIRTKGFIIGVILMPVLMGGGIIAIAIAEKAKDVDDRAFVVVDGSGDLYPALVEAADDYNDSAIWETDDDTGEPVQTDPRWVPELWAPDDASSDPQAVLGERVENGDLSGFVVIGADIERTPESAAEGEELDRTLRWHTDTPSYDDLPDWIESVLNNEIRQRRFVTADLDPEVVSKLSQSERMRVMGLAKIDKETGEVEEEAEASNPIEEIAVPVALVMLMFMLVMMSTPVLLNNVLEEKMQKIAEVLVSSVKPFDLLMGKLLSAVGISLTLAILYVGAAIVSLNVVEVPPMVEAVLPALTGTNLLWFGVFMLLALLIYGSMFSAIGAACSEIQDAQSLMTPAMMLLVVPLMFMGMVIENPDGTFATVLSLLPPCTPIVMFLRVTIPPGVPLWQLLVALGLTVVYTALVIKAAEKIFRVGILMQGQAPTLKKLAGWLMSK